MKNGIWIKWSNSGKKLEEGEYINDCKQGTWIVWKDNEDKIEYSYFEGVIINAY